MSLPAQVNKENFRLLDLSSDAESDDLQLEIIPSRKKKITRRERNRTPANRTQEINIAAEVRCALRWAVRGTLILWLLMLTWLCAALYDQVSSMRLDIAKVSISSNNVDDALQVCHTAAKELRQNASNLSSRLTKLENDHRELAKQVEKAVEDLAGVSMQLAAAPSLADTPKRLGVLQRNVADLGSQIKSFDSSLVSAHKQAMTAATGVDEVKTLLHQLEVRTNETIANVSLNTQHGEELKQQVVSVNSTLEARVDSLQNTIQELTRTTSTVAPTTSTSTTTTSTTTTAAPPTSPPGPTGKPSVLHSK